MNNSTYYTPQYHSSHHKKNDVPIKQLLLKRQSHLRTNTRKGDLSFLAHLNNFANEDITLKSINSKFCYKFAQYLMNHVRINSARTYLQKLHAVLHEAVKQNYISNNPMPPISDLLPHYNAPERAYLTVNEINKLKECACPHESTKLAFLFSCYTGLRISDIETLRWEHIHHQNNATLLVKIQVKTNQEVRIPLGIEALKILNQVKKSPYASTYVFQLHSRTTISADLLQWSKAAKLKKHVTFHVARHSFATLTLSAGVSLFAVSKLCGHTDIKTTQIYAKLMDSTRIEAISNLDQLFANKKRRKLKAINPYDLII